MTICVPIGHSYSSDTERTPSPDSGDPSAAKIDDVVNVLTKARRILVVTGKPFMPRRHVPFIEHIYSGAGISVHAGIPDFRSPTGLFKSLKRENPKEGLSSGKDLFDASVFGVSLILVIPR